MRKRNPLIASILLVLTCTACPGCVEADVRLFVKYEPTRDSFHLMEIYTNIHATAKSDLDHLESLWERRQSIVIDPLPFNLWSHMAVERKGKNRYCLTDLAARREEADKVRLTGVDLDTIKVTPGEFYLNRHRNLAYYHQMVVPGSTVDALLKELAPSIAEFMAEFAEQQIRSAGKENVRRLTWDDVRKTLLEKLAEKDHPQAASKGQTQEEVGPLETASLRLLIKAGAERSVKFTRSRQVFTLTVPLSKRDCHEVVATVDLVREVVADRIKAGKAVEPGLDRFLESFNVRYVAGAGLEVSLIDLAKAANAGRVDVDPRPSKSETEYQTTRASIQGRGIAINKAFSINELVGEYLGK
jgi:hypothetical protein